MAVGTTLGILAATYKGGIDLVVRVVADAVLSIPPLVFLLALVAVLRPSLGTLFLAFCVLGIPTLIRLSRATALRLAERDYVTAARCLRARRTRRWRRSSYQACSASSSPTPWSSWPP